MSTPRQPTPQSFSQSVEALTRALTESTSLAAAALEQAAKAARASGAGSLLKRALRVRPAPARAGDAEVEIRRLGHRLRALHAELGPAQRAQLERDVFGAATTLEKLNWQTDDRRREAAGAGRDRQAEEAGALAEKIQTEVRKSLDAIIPEASVPPAGAAPPGSLLPAAASAFARGDAVPPGVIHHVGERTKAYWGERIARDGMEVTQPALQREAGDPIAAARLTVSATKGIVLGDKLDPANDKRPSGTSVVDTTHSMLALGTSGTGKTTNVVVPYLLQQAAAGHNVVLVTPQVETLRLALPTARALTGQDHVSVIDFAGKIVKPDSKAFCSWDPTRTALTVEGARAFGLAFAGPHIPARADTNNASWFCVPVEKHHAAAAHVTAGLRAVRGLDPHGLNGIAGVYDLMRPTLPDELASDVSDEMKRALAGEPARLRAQQELVRGAYEYAQGFHPRLQRLAYNEHLVRAAGVPLSDDVVGAQLQELNNQYMHLAGRKDGDPIDSLISLFREEVSPHDRLVMSPRPGQREIDPSEFAKPGGGMAVVAYGHADKDTGLAAGVFTSQLLDAAIEQNEQSSMMKIMGGTGAGAHLSLVVDEGGAGRFIPRLPRIVTETRQLGVSTLVSMTSQNQLEEVFRSDAGKFLQAPCVLDMAPSETKAAELSPAFGEQLVKRTSESRGVGVDSQTVSRVREPVLPTNDIANMAKGHAIVVYRSAADGHRVQLVGLKQVSDESTAVGAAYKHVEAHPEEHEAFSETLKQWRPDLARLVELQKNPTAALLETTKAAVAAALADQGPARAPQAAGEPEPAAESAEPQPAAEPVEPEPAEEPVEPEPAADPEQEREPVKAPAEAEIPSLDEDDGAI